MGSLVNKQTVDLSKERIQHSPTIDKVDVDNIGHFETKAVCGAVDTRVGVERELLDDRKYHIYQREGGHAARHLQ